MTAVTEVTDLSWVTFAGEDNTPPCDRTKWDGKCQRQAVVRVIWVPICPDVEDALLCAFDRDDLMSLSANPAVALFCTVCGAEVSILRIEPIR